ncbi:SlyX family protein [Pseudomonas sp. NPDC007930]|uniref:SlyX family protein n=1 Tax=Pseudomonas sp. NPDC007930 TaxID=3364417 RepID=UPI0036E5EA60
MELQERITELETRGAFQDDTIQALNDALVQQRRELDHLQLQMRELIRRFEEMAVQVPGEPDDAPPPHY